MQSQGGAPQRFVTPPAQVIAVRAGRLFDSRAGTLLANQVILIRGDRITRSGSIAWRFRRMRGSSTSVRATVMPGMIDAHVHLFPADNLSESTRTIVGVANAQTDLNAGFTTVLDMDSRGGFGTVDLRNAINRGLVMGPRMQVVGQSLNQRASGCRIRRSSTASPTGSPRTRTSTRRGSGARPFARRSCTAWTGSRSTRRRISSATSTTSGSRTRTLVNSPSLTEEEVMAIVDEAHRLGLKVACHTYGGEGQLSCLKAGVDAPNHLTDLDDASLKLLAG